MPTKQEYAPYNEQHTLSFLVLSCIYMSEEAESWDEEVRGEVCACMRLVCQEAEESSRR